MRESQEVSEAALPQGMAPELLVRYERARENAVKEFGLLRSEDLARAIHSTAENVSLVASKWRRKGEIFAVNYGGKPGYFSWCRREDYPKSRAAAKLLHTKYPSAQGIRWTSRRYPPADCVLLFGDRVPHSSDELLVEAPALRDLHESGTTGFASLQAVMHEAGITPSP